MHRASSPLVQLRPSDLLGMCGHVWMCLYATGHVWKNHVRVWHTGFGGGAEKFTLARGLLASMRATIGIVFLA
jgi:hypothetical protein